MDTPLSCPRVAPYAGAWIEIVISKSVMVRSGVAPYAGAWIEIFWFKDFDGMAMVAPYAGAWIEIGESHKRVLRVQSRSLRGSVD